MEIVAGLHAGSEAIGLVAALARLIKDLRKSIDTSLTELLARLQIAVVRLSRDLENRLRVLSDHIQEYYLNPAKSLKQQFEDLAWYHFISWSRLKTIREECFSIHRDLTGFIEDATAVLICQQRQQTIANAFKASLESKRDLD